MFTTMFLIIFIYAILVLIYGRFTKCMIRVHPNNTDVVIEIIVTKTYD